ncbi:MULTISPECIES: Asp23/Gls24 family envelope stress response protein [unclassified Paenibacillus]|uniref:Asp23/Gls24 family envelope stress response protein n=1 Tax=unclassified Paenibacillus TaxID=185978 RepID=UPI002F3FA55B
MTLQLKSELGAIYVSEECVAVIAGSAAMECYGLVGMASRKQLKDGLAELLGRDNWSRGVVVRKENEELHIDLYIIVSYGTKISEVAHNIQSKVRYVLNDVAGLQVDQIHIFVQDVMVSR